MTPPMTEVVRLLSSTWGAELKEKRWLRSEKAVAPPAMVLTEVPLSVEAGWLC
jgi:hypothetical protein